MSNLPEPQMREIKSSKGKGVVRLRAVGTVEMGVGKKILEALPPCFYAVDIGGGFVMLHHDGAEAGEIERAIEVLSRYGAEA